MKYFLIAGERSGDIHGSYLVKQLKEKDKDAEVYCYGGDQMVACGAILLHHYRNTSFMGFVEVIKHLNKILKLLKKCKADILEVNPDVIVLIDYPGFNLRIAQYAKSKGFKTAYYISPKIWAWNSGRIARIMSFVDKMLLILPFEKQFYKSYGYEAEYVGNPLVEEINDYQFVKLDSNIAKNKKYIAFLPGSRAQELKYSLRIVKKLARRRKNDHFIVAGVDNLDYKLYEILKEIENVSVLFNQTYEILKSAEVSVIMSGTATLEAALLEVPQIVCYRTNPINYFIGRALIKVDYLSLVNLIANKPVVSELIQMKFNEKRLSDEIEKLIEDKSIKECMIAEYREIRLILGEKSASQIAAESIIKMTL